ncbi:hypothetical protein [Spirosoma litoris]
MNEVKQRGILYSAPMVQAHLDGLKTQTRRPNRLEDFSREGYNFNGVSRIGSPSEGYTTQAVFRWVKDPHNMPLVGIVCPYGQVGDILYGRETLFLNDKTNEWHYKADQQPVLVDPADELECISWAHHKGGDYCPSIHMPKFISRIWAEIISIRAEKLHDITVADALAEGIEIFRKDGYYRLPIYKARPGHIRTNDPVEAYLMLYNQLNGISMQDNPWNWVIEYKAIEKPTKKEVANA